MKLLEEIKISVYENVYSKNPKIENFQEIIFNCIHPTYATTINTIRRYHLEGDHEAAQQMKSKLPCFTPAGTFKGAHAIKNFLEPSHIVGLDYDHVPERLEIIKHCAADSHTLAALESPTDGVKIFAYVEYNTGHYREAQQMVSNYYDHLLGLKSDPACKDESRLCYFTYSPNGYIAGLYQAFELCEPPSCSATNIVNSSISSNKVTPDNIIAEASEEEIKQFLSSYIFLNPLVNGQRHTNLFKLACEACRRGYPHESILREIKPFIEQSNFPIKELENTLSSGYQKVGSLPLKQNPTAESSLQTDKVTKMTYGTLDKAAEADDAYWEGEEFRKKTPHFEEYVYENLPNLLNECILEDVEDREKDISLLSDLTALSAALPQTLGIYNHKKYSPHIFCFVIAPAGSGKSTAQTGRYLLEDIQHWIISTSDHQQKTYQHEHTQWQTECNRKRKSHEECPEEPEKPAYKTLFLSATTSYTRMQTQMQDNDAQGSIIFDTEAQTLSTANNLDCGNFDDMLRKAFEHENIDSSFKANGIKPICIRHPKLAMFLTGTPGQVNNLLGNYENGLLSRILNYTFRGIPHWKEMGDDNISLEDSFKPLAAKVFQMYHFCLNNPVLFHLSRKQWDHLNHTFSQLLFSVSLESNDDLQAVVKRYASLVMRISMIQTRIRQFEENNLSHEIYCRDEDFKRSMKIVLCCYEHSRLLLSSIASPTMHPLKDPNSNRNFIKELPETFSTEEAIRIGEKYGFNNRKVYRMLKSLNKLKIKKVSHGIYTKITES
ncbi:DUF3987 domain-containing protein [Bacteroides sp.]|uniref:DUF3987 domain-containing protein n=1 Tax=Bacteroides sp. TaxID=29523 RepID=UPI00260CF682|nr:DUF3987 domain-containing protein [Bacteroides sp.]MDD3040110.1 DUF3987 domain-containing protein [Bacteroides sp.]